MSTVKLALCADDFGLSPSISEGIINLCRERRLTSVSCLTNFENFVSAARPLQHARQIEIGLHFNLSEGKPLSKPLAAQWPVFPSISHLILRTHAGAIPSPAIEQELDAQWRLFCTAFGKTPDFIDGHQHIHGLPIIRDIVIAKARSQSTPPWIRNTGKIDGREFAFKRQVIEQTGGRALQKKLRQLKLRSNTTLLGVYNFNPSGYRYLMKNWLARLPENRGLIFCHPGLPPGSDNMGFCRAAEYSYLISDKFIEDLDFAQVELQPINTQDL